MQDERSVIRVTGEDAADFLQGLVTNDVRRLDKGAVYAAMLTPQGKYIADFILVRHGDAILIDVARSLAAGLLQRLSMYRLRARVALDMTDIPVTRGLGPTPPDAFADPRHPELGWRAYDGRRGDDADWQALNVAFCVPQSGVELTPDSFILEMGFERLNGVDFRKGCYVGQEVTARMKHKTDLRKGLAQVHVEGRAEPGTEIIAGDKTAGVLYTQSAGLGLAYLRFDRAAGIMQAGAARVQLPQA